MKRQIFIYGQNYLGKILSNTKHFLIFIILVSFIMTAKQFARLVQYYQSKRLAQECKYCSRRHTSMEALLQRKLGRRVYLLLSLASSKSKPYRPFLSHYCLALFGIRYSFHQYLRGQISAQESVTQTIIHSILKGVRSNIEYINQLISRKITLKWNIAHRIFGGNGFKFYRLVGRIADSMCGSFTQSVSGSSVIMPVVEADYQMRPISIFNSCRMPHNSRADVPIYNGYKRNDISIPDLINFKLVPLN